MPTPGKALQLGHSKGVMFSGVFILFVVVQLFESALDFYRLLEVCYSFSEVFQTVEIIYKYVMLLGPD